MHRVVYLKVQLKIFHFLIEKKFLLLEKFFQCKTLRITIGYRKVRNVKQSIKHF